MEKSLIIQKKSENLKERIIQKLYTLRYERKCEKLNIDKDLLDAMVSRRNDKTTKGKEFLKIIGKSKNNSELESNLREFLKTQDHNSFASSWLIGNLTGHYVQMRIILQTNKKFRYR